MDDDAPRLRPMVSEHARDQEIAKVIRNEYTTAASESEYHRGWNDAIEFIARKLMQGAV